MLQVADCRLQVAQTTPVGMQVSNLQPGTCNLQLDRIMNANGSRLSGITKDLCAHWHQTKEHWRDAKCAEFERKYIEELVASVDKTVAVIDQLDNLLMKIRKDCE
jgi:hypothetical protein